MSWFIIIPICGVSAIVNPLGPTIINDYTNCITQILEIDFDKPGLIIFANNNNASTPVRRIRSELLNRIHKYEKYSVEIVSPTGKEISICTGKENTNIMNSLDLFKAIPVADFFIIIIDKHVEFYNLASRIIRLRSWNPLGKFIILLFHTSSNDMHNKEVVENMLSCLYQYNVINIIVLVQQSNNIRKAIIYSWRPYDPPLYCGYKNETAKNRLIVENVCEKGILIHQKNLLGNRVPTNMKGCTLYILALEKAPFISADDSEPNIELLLMRAMLQRFNFKSRYEILNVFRGERDSGEWDGALKELLKKRGDVLLGGIFPDFDVHEDFICSSPYLADSYTWVVPRAYPSPRWVALIVIFDKVVWFSVIVTFLICAVSWKIVGKLNVNLCDNKSFGHCVLNTWICTLGFCTYTRPTNNSLRTFYVFLNLYCIMCITAYQTKLIDVLRNPTFNYQIETVEELVNSGLKFGGFEELHDLFLNSSDPFDNYIGQKWIMVDDISDAMIDVAVHRNFSLLCSRLELAHISAIMPELSDSNGNFKYYSFKMNVFSVPMEMVALKGFPFMRQFTEMLGLLKQAGANAAIRKFYSAFNKRRRARLLRTIEGKNSDIDALSLQHLQGGFLVLALGYILGTLTFFLEISVNKIVKHRKQRS